jgi:hypothetical protein
MLRTSKPKVTVLKLGADTNRRRTDRYTEMHLIQAKGMQGYFTALDLDAKILYQWARAQQDSFKIQTDLDLSMSKPGGFL